MKKNKDDSGWSEKDNKRFMKQIAKRKDKWKMLCKRW